METYGIILQPAKDMAHFADSFLHLTGAIAEIHAREQQQEALAMRLAKVSKYAMEMTDQVDGILTNAEQAGAEEMPTYQQAISNVFQSRFDRIQAETSDPILREALSKKHDEIQLHYGVKFRDVVKAKNKQFALTQAYDSLEINGKKYLSATTEEDEEYYISQAAESINRAEVSGVITPEKIYEHRKLLEGLIEKKTVGKLESVINMAETLSAEQRMQFKKDIVDPTKHTVLSIENRRVLWNKADTAFRTANREQAISTAYEVAKQTWPDARQAMVEVLNPAFMKTHGLDLEQAKSIAQALNVAGSTQEAAVKERQEKNLDVIRQEAINNPVGALKMIRTAEDLDPKDALALQRATESHIRQMSLMSAQEKAVRLDLEDKIKAKIKSDIMNGVYKSEQAVTNAVIAEGLSNTSGFIDDALGTFRNYKKDAGAINYFKAADDDWDRLISTTKSPARKRELQDMKPKVLETLRQQMERDGLRVSDPKTFELYQVNRKALTQTWFQKSMDALFNKGADSSGIIMGGDSFAIPSKTAAPTASPAVMDETTARSRLDAKGVKGVDQEVWIKRYRDAGVVK